MKIHTKFESRNPKRIDYLEKSRCTWNENIKMRLQETDCEGVDWFHVVRDSDQWRKLVSKIMNFQFP
jgi:hypothetical protein